VRVAVAVPVAQSVSVSRGCRGRRAGGAALGGRSKKVRGQLASHVRISATNNSQWHWKTLRKSLQPAKRPKLILMVSASAAAAESGVTDTRR